MPGFITEDDYRAQVALGKLLLEAYWHPDPEHRAALQDSLARRWAPRCNGGEKSRRHLGRSHLQAKREAARRVLASLFPEGIPDPARLPNKLLCAAVARHLPFSVSDDTILRAAGRK